MKYSKAEINQQTENLRQWIPRGSTVFTNVASVSKSGMSREIRVVVFAKHANGSLESIDNEPLIYHPNYAVAVVLGLRQSRKNDGVIVSGCGMDMCWHLVTRLAHALYGDEKALNQRSI